MTIPEIRAAAALLQGPTCGKPWRFKRRGHPVIEYTCDLPAGHPPGCGHDQDRGSTWFDASVALLAEIDKLSAPMKVEVRLDERNELDEVVATDGAGRVVVHLEQMDRGHWWMRVSGVTVNLAAKNSRRTSVHGRWDDEERCDEVTITSRGEK